MRASYFEGGPLETSDPIASAGPSASFIQINGNRSDEYCATFDNDVVQLSAAIWNIRFRRVTTTDSSTESDPRQIRLGLLRLLHQQQILTPRPTHTHTYRRSQAHAHTYLHTHTHRHLHIHTHTHLPTQHTHTHTYEACCMLEQRQTGIKRVILLEVLIEPESILQLESGRLECRKLIISAVWEGWNVTWVINKFAKG